MSETRKLVLFFNGTFSTNNATPQSTVGKLAAYFMYHPNNILTELYENCLDENKFHFDGPGTAICSDKPASMISKLFGTVAGAVDGHFGMNSIEDNLTEVKKIFLEQAAIAKAEGKPIEIHIFDYSRGGVLAWRFKKELAQLMEERHINVASVHLVNIDPVAGGPTDRFWVYWYSNKPDPQTLIFSTTYVSPNGNVKWPFSWNMPMFSGFDMNENAENTINWSVNGNHEGIGGRMGHKPDDHPEKIAGLVVLGDILKNTHLKFKPEWLAAKLKDGREALLRLKPAAKQLRGILSPTALKTCFMGNRRQYTSITSLNTEASTNKAFNP